MSSAITARRVAAGVRMQRGRQAFALFEES